MKVKMRNIIKNFYKLCDNESIKNNLEKLKILTENLPSFPEKILDDDYGYREYKMDAGTCFSWFIHRSGNNIAVHRWFNSSGTEFQIHVHLEKEWIIIYEGSMEFIMGDIITLLKKGDYVVTEPNIPHAAHFPEDCKYITVTIPPSKDYNYLDGKNS